MYIVNIRGTSEEKEPNDMKLPIKWIVTFKRGKIEIECRQWMLKLITMRRCHETRDMNTFIMGVIQRLIYEEIVTHLINKKQKQFYA